MSIVTLVSGGLDSTVMAALAQEAGIQQFPLFIDYGQRALCREKAACRRAMRGLGVPAPHIAELGGFGAIARSGLTDATLHPVEDAFTPGRNLLFLLAGASYAYTVCAAGVAVGLLDEGSSLFPDQTNRFLADAELLIERSLGRPLKVMAPLRGYSKADVVRLARKKRITGTYSCHMGRRVPCGRCIACREFLAEEE